MAGEVLSDRYELEELVGRGGMSSVYRAHDRLLERKVALKILDERLSADEAQVERFRREARTVASLSHPNVVTVIDRGAHGGRQFIVFEYVDGENLKRLLERSGRLPVERALELGVQVASGLAFAHASGLVHRDVKPQNVLLNGDGEAKVTDFGIARALDVQAGMTQTGTVLGTADYIAPEQAQGAHVDEQSDVYSLGVVLYELLTGQVPFPAENFVAVAMRHINEPPPLVSAVRADVPPRVGAAVERAMAKDPRARWETMDAFRVELEACLAQLRTGEWTQILPGPAPARRHATTRRPRAFRLALAVGVLVAVAAAATILATRRDGALSPAAAAVPVPLRGVTAYDPFGTGAPGENDSLAGLATDGNVSTAWPTERYYDAPSLGKPGVGLVLDAGRSVRLATLRVRTVTPGFVAVIRAGDSTSSFPDTVSGSETVVDGATFAVHGPAHRYYLLWITRLGPVFDYADVNEVTARGP